MDKTCILIVDDNPEIREIINVLLGGEGFEVSSPPLEKPSVLSLSFVRALKNRIGALLSSRIFRHV